MIKALLPIAIVGFLAMPLAHANTADEATATPVDKMQTESAGASAFPNPMDPSTWHDGAGHVMPGQTIAFNPADPAFWQNFADPKMHSKMHMAFTNPAQYMQMLDPAFYTQMMNPEIWVKWMQPQNFQVMMSPDTWTYWMQPGAYMHGANIGSYMQMTNPAAYAGFMNPAAYAGFINPAAYMPAGDAASNGENPLLDWFNMSAMPYTPQTQKQ